MTRPEWIQEAEPGMPEPQITYHPDGVSVLSAVYKDHKRRTHRTDGPAITEWFSNGIVKSKQWVIHGSRHREDGPAIEEYREDGSESAHMWYQHNRRHRTAGPAFVFKKPDGSIMKELWYEDGIASSVDGKFIAPVVDPKYRD